MGQQHQTIAAMGELEGLFAALLKETRDTFSKKQELFGGHEKTLEMKDEDRKFEEEAGASFKSLNETVPGKLLYLFRSIAPYLDAKAQFEATNQVAKADLVWNGQVLISDAPATLLLGLENILKRLREMCAHIPTLEPGHKWVLDSQQGKYIYADENLDVRDKSEKGKKFISVAKATDKHPEQVQAVEETVVVGKYITKNFSGRITPAQKSAFLARLDSLHRATKDARMVANTAETVNIKIAEPIIAALLGDLVDAEDI